MSVRRVSAPGVVLVVAVLGTFMAFVDATIVNIAVPDIARHFSGSRLSSVSWVLNAYNIVFAAFLVGGGQLADLLGRRRVFSLGLVLFTCASALCAVAPTLGLLVAFRAIQAAGAALLVPSSLAIVLEAHDVRRRTHAVAMWSAVAALAAGIGPPLGGILITASSWRLVFLVNIPVGLLALVLTRRVLVESRAPGRRRVPDLFGGLLLALAIAALVLAIVKGPEWGWGDARVLGGFAATLLLGAGFLARSARHRAPVVDLSLLRIRAFALSNGITVVMAAGFYAYTLCNVLFLTSVWRYSILDAGLALTPGPIIAMAVAGPGSRLVERFSHRAVAVPGALVWAAGTVYFATRLQVEPHFLGRWLPGMAILGVGAGLTFPTLSAAAVSSVPGPRFAIASSLSSVSRQIGAALGVAALIAIVGRPTSLQALHAFRHGWLFAGGCFIAGAIGSIAIVLRTPSGAEQALPSHADAAIRTRSDDTAPREELPSLIESTGERAEVQPQSVGDFLRNVPVFAPLSDELRAQLAGLADSVRLSRGEWLFHEGDAADGVYIVRLGHLEVVAERPALQRLNTLTRGAVLGELALLSESRRSGSVRALRDSELLRIDRDSFTALLHSEPELALGLTRVLSRQLQASRAIPVQRRARPVTIALHALYAGVPVLDLADQLSRAMCEWGRVAVLYPGDGDSDAGAREVNGDGAARFAPLIENCEQDHQHVLLVCGPGGRSDGWDEFCLSRADRVIAVGVPGAGAPPAREALEGCDLVMLGVSPGAGELTDLVELLGPSGIFAVSDDSPSEDIARMARRLAGRSLGVVLGGGGARAFAHLGALDVLLDAGVVIDRVAGVSMGAFVGAQLACGRNAAEIDACCYEEWVRRNPVNDYTVPRHALVKGRKAEAMLERVFGDARIEELARSFYCASVDLRGNRLVIDRTGPLWETVGASISLPLIAPPLKRGTQLLIDGSLLDNLPLAPMSAVGEGPVLAIDIKGGGARPEPRAADGSTTEPHPPGDSRPQRGLPSLPETMARVALLSSANTDEASRRFADMTIAVRVPGVGLTEFHQIDAAREAGRRSARAALDDAPEWLLSGDPAPGAPAGRKLTR
jgi:EmrB/QacA subfamily drug resistance transporter